MNLPSVRWVKRKGEKVLQELVWVSVKEGRWEGDVWNTGMELRWQDVPTVDEETGEEIKG